MPMDLAYCKERLVVAGVSFDVGHFSAFSG
jgi:hypothetical protein